MNKKAMGVGQVFVFIIAALSFALIMIFGYQMISGFIISGEKVAFAKFTSDLSSSVQKIYTEYGAVRVKEFRVPGSYTKICFVDMDAEPETKKYDEMQNLCKEDPLACSVWQDARVKDPANNNKPAGYSAVDQNVFLTPTALTPIKVYKISVVEAIEESDNTKPVGFICQDIKRGSFRLLLEGKGDRTQLQFTSVTADE